MKKDPYIFLDIDGVINTPANLHARRRKYMHRNRYWFKKLDKIKEQTGLSHIPHSALKKVGKLYNYTDYRDEYGQLFDDRAIRNLERLIRETGAKIVISSTWRMSGFETMKNMWAYRMLPGEVVGVTCSSYEVTDQVRISDHTISDHWRDRAVVRGHEIKQYCEDHSIENYVIFDDDQDMLEGQLDRFICTRGKYGLRSEHIDKAIKILNGKNV